MTKMAPRAYATLSAYLLLDKMENCVDVIKNKLKELMGALEHKMRLLEILNPEKVLEKGYAILSGKISLGNVVKITTFRQEIEAEIKKIKER